jgi:CubicO group peptidase (beta-lactamase class C family)
MSAHWVIAELIETLSGHPYVAQIHDTITRPLGLLSALGPSVLELAIQPVRAYGQRPGTADLVDVFGDAAYIPQPSVGIEALLILNTPEVRAAAAPGGGGFLRASDLAMIYQGLLHNPAGVFPEAALEDARSHVRNRLLDELSGVAAARTLTYCTAGDDGHAALRSFPATAPRAFGHMGAGGQLAWADPDTGLSFAFLNDTLHQDPGVEFLRARDLNALAMACLP